MAIVSINPASGETLRRFEPLSDTQIDAKLQLAMETFRSYQRTSFAEPAHMLLRAGVLLCADSAHQYSACLASLSRGIVRPGRGTFPGTGYRCGDRSMWPTTQPLVSP